MLSTDEVITSLHRRITPGDVDSITCSSSVCASRSICRRICSALKLIGVSGFYYLPIIREYLRAKPFAAFEKKAAAAMQAADLGWLAMVCGPLFKVFIFLPVLPISLFLGPPPEGPLEIPKLLFLMVVAGAVAGATTACAFWASSALLGNVRKAAKLLRSVRDPEFD